MGHVTQSRIDAEEEGWPIPTTDDNGANNATDDAIALAPFTQEGA